MPVFSLPSPYGIGTLGKAAYDFIDFLKASGQKYWQMLPLGPTGYGDSPYQSISTFAGNPYLIDLDMLIADGLLTEEDVLPCKTDNDKAVDYGFLWNTRYAVLKKAAERGLERDAEALDAFRSAYPWLRDYALYMALKKHFDWKSWNEWPDTDLKLHKKDACSEYAVKLKEDVEFYEYLQYLFYKQWDLLRAYANENGIGIIGDLPIYVSMDSSDVWAEPQLFELTEEGIPTEVSGVPPDYFNADGQLWGNPLYRWSEHEKDGYAWWINRVGAVLKLYDVLRFDHFRGMESYWTVPYGEKTAKNGKWVKGPGMKLIGAVKKAFPNNAFIAEDLGYLTEEVKKLLSDSEFPGMKVLEFAFDSREPSDYCPHTYPRSCVCYTGTHDNSTALGGAEDATEDSLKRAGMYLGLSKAEGISWGMIRGGMSSVADLFIAQMQDYLEIGAEGRVNTPGIPQGNWTWRMKDGVLTKEHSEKICSMAELFG